MDIKPRRSRQQAAGLRPPVARSGAMDITSTGTSASRQQPDSQQSSRGDLFNSSQQSIIRSEGLKSSQPRQQDAAPLQVSPEATPQSVQKPKKRRLWRWVIGIVLTMIMLTAAGAAAAWWWYTQQLTAVVPQSKDAVQIVVSQGATIASVTGELENKGLIKNSFAVQMYHRFQSKGDIKAGVYTFTKGQTPAEMLAILAKGATDEARITFKPGETIMDARKVLQQAGYTDGDITKALMAAYAKYPMMKDRPSQASVEGFILGETYSYTKQFTVENILDRPFQLLQQLIDKENLEEAFAKHGLSLYQGVILASIIQKEVSKPEDMALVSSVFHNRLKKGMQLGSDVTAAYGVQVQGRKTSVVEAVSIDTPYNTRIHAGLPPTPIASPGLRALRAAANPVQSDYLYFVAGDDGKTYFATTNEEHERNTKQYCDKLCKL